MTFRLTIQTPEACAYDGEAESLVAPSADGFFGVLANHAPMVGVITVGVLTVRTPAGPRLFAVGDGVAEVGGNAVRLLVEVALPAANEGDAEVKREAYLKDKALPPYVARESMPGGK
jgi:F-type H+-transporting ATPase subunit epsilon